MGWPSHLQHSQGQRSQHRQSQDHGSRNQSSRHSQPQRQSGQDRQARTSGTRTRLRGANKARTRNPRTRRVKPRVRPATPQTGAATPARINASGCRAGKAGSGEPLRLRIASLSHGAGREKARGHVFRHGSNPGNSPWGARLLPSRESYFHCAASRHRSNHRTGTLDSVGKDQPG